MAAPAEWKGCPDGCQCDRCRCDCGHEAAAHAERARAEAAEGFLGAAKEERDRWIARYGEVADRLHDVTTRPAEALERARRWLGDVEHEDGARGETYETMRDLVAEVEGAHDVARGFINKLKHEIEQRALAAEAERDAARADAAALRGLLVEAGLWLGRIVPNGPPTLCARIAAALAPKGPPAPLAPGGGK